MRNGKLISTSSYCAYSRGLEKIHYLVKSGCSPHYRICAPYDMIYRQSCDNLHLDGLIHVAYGGGLADPASLITG